MYMEDIKILPENLKKTRKQHTNYKNLLQGYRNKIRH